ncbi:MAG: hypothetical protein MHPSP_001143, partial [Paramarteilia canceri]
KDSKSNSDIKFRLKDKKGNTFFESLYHLDNSSIDTDTQIKSLSNAKYELSFKIDYSDEFDIISQHSANSKNKLEKNKSINPLKSIRKTLISGSKSNIADNSTSLERGKGSAMSKNSSRSLSNLKIPFEKSSNKDLINDSNSNFTTEDM